MKVLFPLLLSGILFAACEAKQWNLNKSIGWESDHELRFLYVNWERPDTTGNAFKMDLDKRISEKLGGGLAENDSANQTDLLFIVPKDYEKALEIIIKETRSSNQIKKIRVFEREYVSENEWVDKVVYEE